MDASRQNDVSPEAMQARIQQARREAETLKDRIKRKKDELADTTRELSLLTPLVGFIAVSWFHKPTEGRSILDDVVSVGSIPIDLG